jgi:hypothetical protein
MTPLDAGHVIFGLVCGLPGERAWRRRLLMLKAYKAHIDASGTGDPDLLVLAGYVAPAIAWGEFSIAWKSRLDECGIPFFKMNEWASRPEVAAYFYRLIEEHDVTAAISVTIRTDQMRKAIREYPWPGPMEHADFLKNPYYFGYKAITDILAQHQDKFGVVEPVDFIFDNQSEEARLGEAWHRLKLASSPEIRRNMGDVPSYKNDKSIMPLQAADLYAWWILKWMKSGVTDWCEKLPFPWTIKRDIPRIDVLFEEDDFVVEFSRGLREEARALWDVDDPVAALRELEERERRK